MSKFVAAITAAIAAVALAAPVASALDPTPLPVVPPTPAYTLVAHCAGFTFDSVGWPAGSKVWIQVSRPRGAQTVRVNNRLVGASGVVHEKIRFQLDSSANLYRIQVVAPLGGPKALVLAGSQNSCTPQYASQLPGVTPMPAGWLTSGGFTG
jgi:hypothetical protein